MRNASPRRRRPSWRWCRRRREGWLGRVRLGTSTIALNFHLPPVLRRLRSAHPYIELAVTSGTIVAVLAQLAAQRARCRPGQSADRRSRARGRAAVRRAVAGDLSADANGVPSHATPQSLAQHSLLFERPHAQVNELILAWFAAAGFAPRPAMELDNLGSAARMVGVGLGVSIVPERVADRRAGAIRRPGAAIDARAVAHARLCAAARQARRAGAAARARGTAHAKACPAKGNRFCEKGHAQTKAGQDDIQEKSSSARRTAAARCRYRRRHRKPRARPRRGA